MPKVAVTSIVRRYPQSLSLAHPIPDQFALALLSGLTSHAYLYPWDMRLTEQVLEEMGEPPRDALVCTLLLQFWQD
jgi:hypothetical protein